MTPSITEKRPKSTSKTRMAEKGTGIKNIIIIQTKSRHENEVNFNLGTLNKIFLVGSSNTEFMYFKPI